MDSNVTAMCALFALFGQMISSGDAVAPLPFRCYDCQGIDLASCLDGANPVIKNCHKGVESCYMTYRRAGSTDQVARGCRDAGALAKPDGKPVCSKSSLFGLLTIICSCSTNLCNGNSTAQLQGIPDRFFVEW
ncbi:hypothetical protein BV898_11519 [Hypsibius exemplaris]|uniref:UPAR/Ly6 domain-containing protein n=1 Tax=Hypsibius exemplaris TaxID=2072580 RepID=A0A1W0WGG9_HYPEX|nr:hypothetical protein BV898_11519 [Hypsibius exemplaris]